MRIQFVKHQLRCEDVVRKDIKALNSGLDWRARAANRNGWRVGYLMEEMTLMPEKPAEEED